MKKSNLFLLLTVIQASLSAAIPTSVQAAEVYFEKDTALPLVYVTVAFKGGATQDPDGKNGLTDIMAKAMLRGTKSHTKQQLDLMLDQLGASLGVETRAEFLAFRGMVLSENIKPFLDLITEIISAPSFRNIELEKLKKEQSSGLMDDLNRDPSLARLRFDQIYFKGHPYSKSNEGRIKDIQSISTADVQKQYQQLINQNEMVVLAGGDTRESEISEFVKSIAQKRPAIAALSPVSEFKGDPQKIRVVIFDKPERTQTQIVIGQKGINHLDSRIDALQIANFAFGGGGFQSRLMQELRVKRGWTYGAGSGFKIARNPQTWRVSFFPKNADTPAAIQEALKMIRTLKEKGLTEKEFEFAKKSIINGAGFNFNTPAKRLENRLSEILLGLPEGYFKNLAQRISKISLEDVNQALASFVKPDQIMIGLVATAAVSQEAIAKGLGIPAKDIEVIDYRKE